MPAYIDRPGLDPIRSRGALGRSLRGIPRLPLVGDFLLQTDWQATHKFGGLGPNRESRRALLAHTATYTLAFVPALIWLATDIGAWAIGIGLLIGLPHMVQDDGRLLDLYVRRVKGLGGEAPSGLRLAVDQTGHAIALFLIALLAAS